MTVFVLAGCLSLCALKRACWGLDLLVVSDGAAEDSEWGLPNVLQLDTRAILRAFGGLVSGVVLANESDRAPSNQTLPVSE